MSDHLSVSECEDAERTIAKLRASLTVERTRAEAAEQRAEVFRDASERQARDKLAALEDLESSRAEVEALKEALRDAKVTLDEPCDNCHQGSRRCLCTRQARKAGEILDRALLAPSSIRTAAPAREVMRRRGWPLPSEAEQQENLETNLADLAPAAAPPPEAATTPKEEPCCPECQCSGVDRHGVGFVCRDCATYFEAPASPEGGVSSNGANGKDK